MESGLLAHVPVWDAIGDLPPLMDAQLEGAPRYLPDRKTPFNRRMRKSVKNLSAHEFRPLTPAHQKLLRYVPQGGSWRDIPPHLLPDRFRGMRRTDSSNVLGRLDPARPSYTITTQFMNVTVGCFGHPFEDRGLSIREAARLQTFPDRYRFHGSFGSQAKQIGNAVPPLLASRLADAIAEQTGLRPAKQQPKPIKRSSKALPVPCRLGEEALLRLTTTGRLSSKDLVEAALLGVDESPAAREPNAPSWEPAFAFEPERLAIFVRECFLDGCEVHSPETASRLKWWKKRIEANVDANRRAEGELERTDWSWEVVWEHENPEHAALRIKGQVEQIRLDSDRPERFST